MKTGNVNKKTILLVDDEDFVREALKKNLEKEEFEVTTVTNGKSAQELLGIEAFDLLLSDIHMPGSRIGGIELLQYVKQSKFATMPVILMTGFATLNETNEASRMGANGFLAKPFKRDELLELVRSTLGVVPAPEAKVEDPHKYCKLSIDDFVSGRNIKFDIFVKLSETKYVKVAHHGENIPVDRIQGYKSKGIKFLYMREEAFQDYIQSSLALTKAVKFVSAISPQKKLNLMKHTGEVILEYLHSSEITPDAFDDAKAVIENTVSLLASDGASFDLISTLNSHCDFLYAHSLGVSLYSVLLSRQLGWDSPVTLFKVSISGMMHDIGKKEIDRALLMKPRPLLSPEEIRLYETHPARGMEILSRVASIPTEVVQIVAQHQERDNGSGYPSGLTKARIHPIARLIAVADEFCKLAVRNPDSPGIPPKEAMKKLLSLYGETLDSSYLAALAAVVGLDEAPKSKRKTT